MLKSLHILLIGMLMLVPLAFGQLGSLSDFDGVLQTKFALEISKVESVNEEAQSFTLTSGELVREYGLPGTARVYWVFDFEGLSVQGGLVVADSETGKIYVAIAEATQLTNPDLSDPEVGASTKDSGADSWLTANYAWRFDLGGFEFSASAQMAFQFTQAKHVSYLRMGSVAGVTGKGIFADQSLLQVTGGSISASGIITDLD